MPLGHEVAHLSHLTLNTPVLDKSVDFFVDYLGMAVNGEDNGKVFLRTWDEYEHHTITLTQNDVAGDPADAPACSQPGGTGPSHQRARERGVRHRLGGRRTGLWADLPLQGPRRSRVRPLLGLGMVRGTQGLEAGVEEPGTGLPGSRCGRAST